MVRSNTSLSCALLATAGKGVPRRLRASRTRLPKAMSDSGPVPFIHPSAWPKISFIDMASPPFVRPSQGGFQGANLVPQLRRLLILLCFDRPVQLFPEAPQILLRGGSLLLRRLFHMAPRRPPGVPGVAVDPAEQRLQLTIEHLIALAASQMAQPAEVGEAQAATGTAHPRPLRPHLAQDRLRLEQTRQDVMK